MAIVISGSIIAWRYRLSTIKPSIETRAAVQSDLSGPPHEIIRGSGIYYLSSDTSYGYTASYAIATTEGVIVIDPGLRFDRLRSALSRLKLDVSQVKMALITHRHADHWFSARELVVKTGAKILAHADEIPVMTQPADLPHYFSVYATPVTSIPTLEHVEPIKDGDFVELGKTKIHVLGTPGHTPGSLCFRMSVGGYDVTFTGDTIMTLSPDATDGDYMTRLGSRFGGDLRAYIGTLKRLSHLNTDILLPGHPLLGQGTDPVSGARRWKEAVPLKIAMLSQRLKQFESQASLFLDGTPKPLSKDVFYLGEQDQTACYVIRDGGQLICIDPGKRSLESLTADLQSLGLAMRDVRLVLLTGVAPDHSAVARELCDASGADLYCGPLSADESTAKSLRPTRMLQSMDEFNIGKFHVTALAGSPGAGADLCYLVETPGHRILVGGDSVGRFPKNPRSFHPDVDETTLLMDRDISALVQFVRNTELEFVLPAHPQYDESPFYAPGEWQSHSR